MKKLISLIVAIVIALSLSVPAFAAPSADVITKDEAKAIVLEHSGYTAEDVRFTKAKLEFDDGRYEYEIEFNVDRVKEYEYTVNAETGRIVDFDFDYDAPNRFSAGGIFAWIKNILSRLFG